MPKKKGNSVSLGYLLMNLGIDHQYLGNLDIALDYYQRAEKVFRAIGAQKFISTVLMNIGTLYQSKKDHKNALVNYNEALKIGKRLNNGQAISASLCSIGGVYAELNENDKAEDYLQQSLEISEQINDEQVINGTLNQLANVYIHTKKYHKAQLILERMIERAQKTGAKPILLGGYSQMVQVYAALNNYRKAYEYQERFMQLNDSVFSEEKSKQIADMEFRYKTVEKGKEIELLNKDKEVMQSRLSRKNLFLAALAFGGALTILLVILLYNRRTLIVQNQHAIELNKQQQQMTLAILNAQEEERQKIAKDMHDSLGAYLSSIKLNMEVIQPDINAERSGVFQNMSVALNKVTAEVRALAKNLVSDTLQQYGLAIAVEELVELVNQSKKIHIDFTSNEFNRFHPSQETGIFRIIQELVNNALKHSDATKITIDLSGSDELIRIWFTDNGVGFNINEQMDGKKGIGLKNMEARTKILKGTFNAESTPGSGSSFKIEIPVAFHDFI